jgi:hypothetical protein
MRGLGLANARVGAATPAACRSKPSMSAAAKQSAITVAVGRADKAQPIGMPGGTFGNRR